MNLIKGLEHGFFHTWVTGDSSHRMEIFKSDFKIHVDAGKFIRDIQNAPRDARYKIDHYYSKTTTKQDTIPYTYLNFFTVPIKVLQLDETFNFKQRLKDPKAEYQCGNDFIIGYGINNQYYFKYQNEINTLKFDYQPKLVDYNDIFWAKYKDQICTYSDIQTLFHNLEYFILYKGLDKSSATPKLHPLS